MLLTCPACGARYRAPDDAIPATGRFVRCSACRAEWRALPAGDAEAAPARQAERPATRPPAPPAPALAASAPAPVAAAQQPPVAGPTPPPPSSAPANMAASLNAEPVAQQGWAGFVAGFVSVAVVAGAAVALYLNHEAAAAAVPQLAGPLARFVAAVDALRASLAGLMPGRTPA